jgi:hypothetical protein
MAFGGLNRQLNLFFGATKGGCQGVLQQASPFYQSIGPAPHLFGPAFFNESTHVRWDGGILLENITIFL